MKFTVTEPTSWKRVIEIEVPSTDIQGEVDSAYKRYRKQIKLPGFRQGKIPLDVLKARFGDEIKAEVLQRLVPEFYEKACGEAKIVPLNQAAVEDVEYDDGQDLRFKAVVEVKPPLNLDEYKGVRVTKRPANVTDDDINNSLNALQDRHADIVRVDGAAEHDHYLLADIQTLDTTGVPIVGRKTENQFLQIGSGKMGEAFDEHLLGIKAGEERHVKTVYPEDHEDNTLAGQDAYLLVSVRDVLEKRLPELDDDFAVDVGAENLEALKTSIRHELEQEPEREMQAQLVDHLVENNSFDVPESMLNTYLDRLVSDAGRRSREPIDEEELRQHYRPMAINQIKRYLILEEIAECEHIDVPQDALDERVERIATQGNIQVEQVRRMFREDGRMERIESEIREEKVIEFLVQHADIQVE